MILSELKNCCIKLIIINLLLNDPVTQEGYLTEAQQYAQETELSRRVRDWEERIVPVLAQEVHVNRLIIKKKREKLINKYHL